MGDQLNNNGSVTLDNSVGVTAPACEAHGVEDENVRDCDSTKHVVPDGGWGWVVCAACFMSHVLTDGIQYSFGVVFVELLDYFKGSKGETAIVASISAGICYLSGPIVAIFTDKYGCRIITAIGTFVFSGSLVLSIFAPSIQFLYFSLGALFGFGYGMIYLPSIVCVSQHFDNKRALATGIGVSGAGVGTFIFSPLTSILIRTYAWQGALLIQAGLALNCFICAIVFRPVINNAVKSKHQSETDPHGELLEDPCKDEFEKYERESDSAEDYAKDTMCIKSAASVEDVEASITCTVPSRTEPLLHDESDTRKPMASEVESVKKNKSSGALNKVWRNLLSHFDVEIFRNVAYCMFLVSTFLYSLGYYIPYIYLPDTAREAGISDLKASLLVSSVGITNTFGRVLFGFLSDRKWVNRLVLYATALVICGASTCVGPLLSSFPTLLVYTMVFGTFSGVTISLTSVLISDIVGIHKLAHGLGVSNFFGGIGSFAGPPLAGWLYDVSGNYLASYITAGAAIFVSGAMLYPVPYIENQLKIKKEQP